MSLLPVAKALEKLLALVEPVGAEEVSLPQAGGRVLAETCRASFDMPSLDTSSMDGFAVQAKDLVAASVHPVRLQVVADIPAGKVSQVHIESGQAARIMTGAPLPAGADAVVPVEDTDFHSRDPGTPLPEAVTIFRTLQAGSYVRPKGQDFRTGQVMLAPGLRLRPQDVGLLAMLGHPTVRVYRQPRVALLSSGDELLPVGEAHQAGKIYDSNIPMLSGLIRKYGGVDLPLGVAPDDPQAVRRLMDQAVDRRVDLILSSAGVSVGAYDYVRLVVEQQGKLDFWRVNMRPGKPMAVGNYRGTLFIGLPGNPVSAFAGFEVFVRPALIHLGGEIVEERPKQRVTLAEAVRSDGRETYMRVVVQLGDERRLIAQLTGHQGSGNLLSLVKANGLLILPAGTKSLPAGAEAEVWMLEKF